MPTLVKIAGQLIPEFMRLSNVCTVIVYIPYR